MMRLKSKIALLGSLFIILTLVSCKESVSPVPNVYELFLEFRDAKGNNLLNDFNVDNFKTDLVIKSNEGEVLNGFYTTIENAGGKVLKIHSSTLPGKEAHVLTYVIQNEKLMGNTDKHVLETKWSFSNNNAALSELAINGIKQSPKKDNALVYYVLTKE